MRWHSCSASGGILTVSTVRRTSFYLKIGLCAASFEDLNAGSIDAPSRVRVVFFFMHIAVADIAIGTAGMVPVTAPQPAQSIALPISHLIEAVVAVTQGIPEATGPLVRAPSAQEIGSPPQGSPSPAKSLARGIGRKANTSLAVETFALKKSYSAMRRIPPSNTRVSTLRNTTTSPSKPQALAFPNLFSASRAHRSTLSSWKTSALLAILLLPQFKSILSLSSLPTET